LCFKQSINKFLPPFFVSSAEEQHPAAAALLKIWRRNLATDPQCSAAAEVEEEIPPIGLLIDCCKLLALCMGKHSCCWFGEDFPG
jgi:hypothetical protein